MVSNVSSPDGCTLCEFEGLKEMACNHEASEYMQRNYYHICSKARSVAAKQGVPAQNVEDLVNDVFMSILESENNGEGYDEEHGNGEMSVEKFIFGRLKRYALNSKYRSDISETKHLTLPVTKVVEIEIEEGRGKKKHTRVIKQKVKENIDMVVTTHAATPNGMDDADENDSFQKAYGMAAISDSSQEIADMMDIRSNIDTCIDICSLNNVNIINILKNIDQIGGLLPEPGRKKTHESVFDKLNSLCCRHDELNEAFRKVMDYSMNNHAELQEILRNEY